MFHRLRQGEFYNFGGAVYRFEDAFITLDRLIAAGSKPALILLGLDWWRFQTDGDSGSLRSKLLRSKASPLVRDTYDRLRVGKRRATEYATFVLDQVHTLQHAWRDPAFYEALNSSDALEPESRRLLLGLGARRGGGFRNDGSYRYWKTISDPPSLESKRAEAFERFDRGMYHGNAVWQHGLQEYERFLTLCRRLQIDLVVFLPPVDSLVHSHFTGSEAGAFWKSFEPALSSISRKHGVPFADYTVREGISDRPEEFFDWFHGSDVMFARILLDMAKSEDASLNYS